MRLDSTLGASLRQAAERGGGTFTYVDDAFGEHRLSPRSWLDQAAHVHGGLRAAGITPHRPVVIQIEHGVRFVQAFWGTLLAGAIPAPLGLPESFAPDVPGMDKLLGVCRFLGQDAALLTDADHAEGLAKVAARTGALPRLLVLEDLLQRPALADHVTEPDDLALLMFSSGSTGLPKGVQLSHANVLANVRQLIERSCLTVEDRSATWLPYSHDMGLVLFHLTHALAGIPQWKVDSTAFLRDPLAFLRLLEDASITVTGQPNFAFDHILRRVPREDLAALDLSHIRLVYNGAEPISPALCREFVSALEPAGLRPDAILPGFGIAEASVCASGFPYEREGRGTAACPSLSLNRKALAEGRVQLSESADTLELACLGPVLDGMTLRVEDEAGKALPEGRVGRLCIKGPNVARGYFGRIDDPAFLADGFLDTGDLGFQWKGDVYISGREKDIVFVHGLKFYSQDLEAVAQDAAGLAPGDAAVVATRTDDQRTERIALFVRMPRREPGMLEKLAQARSHVARRLNRSVDAVVPLPALPRTSSGKLRRRQLADELAAGIHDAVIRRSEARLQALRVIIPPDEGLEASLIEACRRAGAEGLLSVEAPFIDLMGDSLKLAGLLLALQRSGAHPACAALTLADLLSTVHVRGLAHTLSAGEVRPRGPALRPVSGDVFSPSRSQQDLLFWEAFDGSGGRYHEAYACTLEVDEERLRGAVESLVARNSALRTVFVREEGRLVQRILPRVSLEWEQLATSQNAEARFTELAARPFDLIHGPLHRFAYRAGGRFLMVFHHLVMDGFGMTSFLRQLRQVLDGTRLEPEAVRPAEVQAWIQARLQDQAAARAHWKPLLQNPSGRRPGRDGAGPTMTRLWSCPILRSRVETWEAASQGLGLTPFQGALLAFLLLLAEQTEDDRPIVGVTAPGRSHPMAQELVGYLSNTLAVQLDIRACASLGEAAAAVKSQATALLRHQDFPLSLFLEGQGSPATPYHCALSFMPSPLLALETMAVRELRRLRGPAKLDLLVSIETSPEGWTLFLEGDGQRLSTEDLEAFGTALCRRLDLMTEGPDLALPLWRLRAADQELPSMSVAPRRTSPRFQRVTDAFEAAAFLAPARTALTDQAGSITYAVLRENMDSLAAFLRARGVLPDTRALICTAKGRSMVQAVLGTLKAGAAYVPCDAELPEARIRQLVDMAEPVAILCDAPQAARLTPFLPAGPRRFCLGTQKGWETCPLTGVNGLEPLARGDDPIYLHFTSGSTGEPKGIVNSHTSVCHLLDNFLDAGFYGPGDGVPQLVSFGFEAFAAEIFPALAAGATVHCLPPLRQIAPADLARLMAERGITIATVTPSFALQLVRGIREAEISLHLHHVLFGGEVLLPSHVSEVRAVLPATELVNLYGPTEATVHTTSWTVPAVAKDMRIGTPLPGKRVLLLDGAGFLALPGEPGEIWIGGAGLASGYWRDPQRTLAAFVSLELKPGRRERFYRTGDLAVLEPDGALRFLGRKDFQVKIHGQRVELEEVERVLATLPGVWEACVVAHGEPKRLAAFYVGPPAPEALRGALLQRLPAYMVPSTFRALPVLPTTANAKVDRKALEAMVSEPESPIASPSSEYAPLREAWRKVLGRDPESEAADFFLSGGDSIRAMELCAALSVEGFRLGPKDVYDHPTFASLAARLTLPPVSCADEVPAVTGAVALTPIQHWFFEQELTQPQHWLQSRAFRLIGKANPEAMERALLALVNHHDQLRAVFQTGRRTITQRIREPWTSFGLTLHGEATEEAVSALVASIRLGERLFAAALFQDARYHELVLVAHHLVVDYVSWSILAIDLQAAYASVLEGRTPVFPARTRSFQRHADLLQEQADTPEVMDRLSFWQAQLLSEALKVDPAPLSRYQALKLAVEADRTASLLNRLGKAGPRDLVLTLLGRTLHHLTRQEVVCELESHGRDGVAGDVSRTVGWFTALYPLNLGWTPDPVDHLARVWRRQSEAAHASLTYGLLRYLGNEGARASLERAPRPWLNVNYLGQVDGGAQREWLPVPSAVPLFHAEDAPPFAVVVQAFLRENSLLIEAGLHPDLAARWDVDAVERTFHEELTALDQALTVPSPLSFDRVELALDDMKELPDGVLDVYPMTGMQEAMFFHTLHDPESARYHEQTLYRCPTRLDRSRMERALALLVARHDTLRTVFQVLGGRSPVQLVLDRPAPPVAEVQLQDVQADLDRYLAEDRRHGRFAPGSWPLFRLALLHGAEATYIAFSFHHVLLDGWSQSALVAEIMTHYRDLERGVAPDVTRLASTMRDHVARLAQAATDPAARAFWTDAVGSAPLVQLPQDFVTPEVRTMIGEKAARMVDPELVAKLDGLARRWGVTFNAVCLGAWSYFLGALGGSDDVVTGVVTAGRFPDLADGLKLLGCFLNTLPVRLKFDPATVTLAQLARSAQDFLNASRPFDTYPLKEIVRRVQEKHPDRRRRDLFLHIYAFENYPTEASEQEGLELMDGYDMTNYDLAAVLVKRGGTLRILFEYAPDTVSRATAERWLDTYVSMLAGMAEAPAVPAAALDMRPENQKPLLDAYNDTARPYDLDRTLPQLVEAQVQRTPHSVAVVDRHGHVTYEALDQDANRLARALQATGVEAETLVGVLMPRRCEAVTTFLAVMKAGGTYVPIDPTYPAERIKGILDDADIRHAISCRSVLDQHPDLRTFLLALPHLFLTDQQGDGLGVDRTAWSVQAPSAPPCPATARHLAYVIFTSGSTGKPKGVMITHRAAVNTLVAVNERFEMGPRDAVLGFSSYSFDLSVYDMFGTLACGARLVVATEADIQDSEGLFAWMEETGVTLWNSVPTGMAQLVRTLMLRPAPTRSKTLRVAMLSGEFIPLTLPDQIHAIFPEAHVWSFGGATEGTVWSIHYPIGTVDPAWKSIPYGSPLPNQGYYCLTEALQPCVVDQVGMLYITGEGVAAGYYRDPEKTAAAFVTDPLHPGRIIYRTGDIGRFRGNNLLEILGRKDMQVKVSGYRIELGEVENHLGQALGIGEVAVLALKDGEYSRLVAFYTRLDPTLTAKRLTAFLAARLPDYMVPSRFQALDAMPVNTSGKLDRKRLPALLESTVAGPSGGQLNGELEHRLAAAWSKVLGVEAIGPDHNFFMLGGDSIISLQVASLLASEHVNVRPADLVRHPTVRELARYIATAASSQPLAAMRPGPAKPGPAQSWFFRRLDLEDPSQWHFSMEIVLPPRLETSRLQHALDRLAQRHEALRWSWFPETQEFIPAPARTVSLHERRAEAHSFAEVRAALGQSLRATIRLEPDHPLTAVGLLRGPEEDRLLWVIHHLAVDGVSWRVLLEELATWVEHPNADLPAVGSSFAQWSQRVQAAWLDPLELLPWKTVHAGTWPRLFPGAKAGPEGEAERAQGALDAATTQALLQDVHQPLNTQPQDLALAALVGTLRELTGQRELLVEMEHHGRSLAAEGLDLSRTVGWFTSFYPLALVLSGDSPLEAVIRAKDAQRLLGERAADYLPWSLTQANPLASPQVLFNYVGNLDRVNLPEGWGIVIDGLPDRAPENRRSHPVDVSVWVSGGCLRWEVASSVPGVAQPMARLFGEHARNVVATCAAASAQRTQGDFPMLAPDPHLLAQLQDVEDAYPLSAMQFGMHLAMKTYPKSSMYHVWGVATLKMPLKLELMEEALNRVIQMFEIMRSVILEDQAGRPALAVVQVPRYRVRVVDGLEPEAFFREIDPGVLDTSQWPNFQIVLSRIAPDTYHFLQFFQHYVLDGWSNAILFSHIMEEYQRLTEAAAAGHPLPQARPPMMRYKDFVAYQRRAGHNQASLAFWKETLRGAKALALPTDFPEGARRTFRTVIDELMLDPDLVAHARDHARKVGCTLSDILIGGVALMSYRLTGEEDFTFGYCTSLRPGEIPGIESAAGMFLNTLPLRLTWDSNPSLADQFTAWRHRLAQCRTHEDVPLTRIAEAVRDNCDIFQRGGLKILYTSEVYPSAQLPPEAVGIGVYNWHMTEFDLAVVYSSDTPRGVAVKFAYADDLWCPETIRGWFDLYQDCLRSLVEPAAPILQEQGEADRPLSTCPSFPELWRQRVATASTSPVLLGPHRPVLGASAYSTEALDLMARRVAKGLEIRPHTPLMLDLTRPENVGAALVACLCVGQPFLVLDGDLPPDRRQAVAEALGGSSAQVLTDRPDMWAGPARILDLAALTKGQPLQSWPTVDPETWAYLPMTSGTTGQPKASVISHRALASFLAWYVPLLNLAPGSHVGQLLAPSFDAALSEWLPALIGLGVVTPLPPLAELPVERLDRELRRRKVDVLTLPAAYFDVWSAREAELPRTLRQVMVGGAPLRHTALEAWTRRCNLSGREIPLWNVYGPAEATIAVCAYQADQPTDAPGLFLPVGHLSPSIRVLDHLGQPVRPGQPGEVWLEGPQLMEGRWNGRRLEPRSEGRWATGDQAVVDEVGRVTILGRRDDRVKLRGRWLHLRAAEAVLVQELDLTQALLSVDEATEPRLRVRVVDPRRRPLHELRAGIVSLLPPGVHPNVEALEALPLNNSGKPDVATLADQSRAVAAPAPSAAWDLLTEVLGGDIVAPEEGFYANGGDSLRALQFQALLRQRLGVSIDTERIVSADSVAALSQDLSRSS